MALTNTQYDELMRRYADKQRNRRFLLESRELELYQKSPRLRELDKRMSECSVEQGRMLFEGEASALISLKAELDRLHMQKEAEILKAGYPADYLDPPYECPDCQDTGYADGVKCHCFTQAALDLVYAQSNLRTLRGEERFDQFSLDYYSDTDMDKTTGLSALTLAQKAIKKSEEFVREFDQKASGSNLLFYGNAGVGKTFLSHCVANELLDRGYSVVYLTAFEFFTLCERITFHRDVSGDDRAAYENFFTCDLLILDDLGTEFSNSFTNSQLYLCVDERKNKGKSTIISTNLSIPQLGERYSERIFSRIVSYYEVMKLAGRDIRLQRKMEDK